MNQREFWAFFAISAGFVLNVAFCGKSSLFSIDGTEKYLKKNINTNDGFDSVLGTGKILKRDKRYLLFSGGGISKVT